MSLLLDLHFRLGVPTPLSSRAHSRYLGYRQCVERTARFRGKAFQINKRTNTTVCATLQMLQHLMPLRIKESLRKQFADLANDLSQRLHGVSLDLASVEGPLEVCHAISFDYYI